MIHDHQLFEDINSLPPEEKAEVIDLVKRLKAKKKQKNAKSRNSYGSLKGTFKMSDDFDEPLEEFAEYM